MSLVEPSIGKGDHGMFFRQLLHEERSCVSYLVGCSSEEVVAAIDPQGEVAEYLDLAARHGLRIAEVIETHIHADHPSAAGDLARATGATLRLGPGAEVGFDHEQMSEGDTLQVGNRRIRVIHTPGHTPEHVCLLVDDWFVLTGDTLFVGDVGRVDLALQEDGDEAVAERAKRLYDSLQRLLELEDQVEVFPGHYAGSTCGRGMDGKPVSTIGRERRSNEALGLAVEDFITFQLRDTPPLPQDFHSIKRSNIARGGERTTKGGDGDAGPAR